MIVIAPRSPLLRLCRNAKTSRQKRTGSKACSNARLGVRHALPSLQLEPRRTCSGTTLIMLVGCEEIPHEAPYFFLGRYGLCGLFPVGPPSHCCSTSVPISSYVSLPCLISTIQSSSPLV